MTMLINYLTLFKLSLYNLDIIFSGAQILIFIFHYVLFSNKLKIYKTICIKVLIKCDDIFPDIVYITCKLNNANAHTKMTSNDVTKIQLHMINSA